LTAVEVKPPRLNEVDRPQLVVEAGCGCPFSGNGQADLVIGSTDTLVKTPEKMSCH
jgi:hypothetical protein